jgi:hypothetical protein
MSNTLDHFDIPTNIKDRNTNFKAKCKHCFSVISGSHLQAVFGVPLGRKLKKSSVLTFLAGGEMLSASSSSDLTDSIKENFAHKR